mmetsp:Transcript_19819/g.25516  ORF Transcript_19819/g.25516 Transcript_19819/m.25516 type:complete len:141 (+) Transcript_19819:176-598(+)
MVLRFLLVRLVVMTSFLMALNEGFSVVSKPPAKAYIHRLSMSEEVVEASEVQGEPPKPQVKCPDCDMCDGSGRILGGLGALQSFRGSLLKHTDLVLTLLNEEEGIKGVVKDWMKLLLAGILALRKISKTTKALPGLLPST